MALQANLKQVIFALSDALDLVGIDDVAHGKRVGIMAAECGKVMGVPARETEFLFDLGLLHDIGVSSTTVHRHLVEEFDWEGAQAHAEIGYKLIADFQPLANMALPIRFHHTRWDKLITLDVNPTFAKQANLILLVDRVDALMAPYYANNTILQHKEQIREQIRERAGTYFAPDLVAVFLEASRTEAFWLLLESRAIEHYLREQMSTRQPYMATLNEIKYVAKIFACIVDAKSPFTAEHSLGVSRLSRLLAEKLGVSAENCDKIEIAGLLHDLGKLRVPDEVLDKPAKLDIDERLQINTHTFETYQILHDIQGFEEIARWAGYHHEEPDGSGYPFHIKNDAMPLEARILRVADIFQAMVQDRPYRQGLSASEVMAFMTKLVACNRVDAEIVAIIEMRLDDAVRVARPAAVI